jgi:hypothetical protein
VLETLPLRVDSVETQEREARSTWLSTYLAVIGAGMFLALAGFGIASLAKPFPLAFAALICVAVAILTRPIAGVYLIVFLSVMGDGSTMNWYPFNFNFSSGRSILFISNGVTFSPLELCIALTVVSWFAHAFGARDWQLKGRPLLRPMVVFAALLVLGLMYGLGTGGNITVAMWEIRPLLYMIAIFVLASNLLTRTEHYVRLAWVLVLAISIQNVFAIGYYFSLTALQKDTLEGLTEHPSSLLYNYLFLMALALCVLRGCSGRARVLLLLATVPTIFVFVLSQRRAAFVALLAGFIVFAIVLCFRRRNAFLVLAPLVLILTVGYTAAFWNAKDGVGFGAVAIKSIVAPDSVTEKDASSDLYRKTENYDLVYTAHHAPLTGVGFGKPFYRPIPLPDISFDVFYEYIPHNSILWIWLKTGYFGFVTLLFVIAAAIRAGTRAAMRLPSGNSLAVTVAALSFIVMFVTFAFVDMAWGAQTCVILGVCLATCGNIRRLAEDSGEIDVGPLVTDFEALDEIVESGVEPSRV